MGNYSMSPIFMKDREWDAWLTISETSLVVSVICSSISMVL